MMVGLRQTDIKSQFVSFQVSNWVGSCMAWPAMTMTIDWHHYVNLWYKHGYSITTVCDTSIWSHFSPFPKMEPLQIKTSLWHGHEWNWQMGVLKTLRILRNPDVEGILHFHFCKKGRMLVASYIVNQGNDSRFYFWKKSVSFSFPLSDLSDITNITCSSLHLLWLFLSSNLLERIFANRDNEFCMSSTRFHES